MFKPDIDLAALTSHISYMFHVTIGLDPLGDFSSVQNLSYGVESVPYTELGRNHSPVMLPFDGPGRPGELTLEWGMVVRSKLFNWMRSVQVGGDFRKNIYIFQLSQQRLPLRVYQLTGAWPKNWQASDLVTDRAEWSTEQLTLVYDQIDMVNLSAIAMAGALLGSPINELVEEVRPPGFRPRESGPALPGRAASLNSSDANLKTRRVIYKQGKAVEVRIADPLREYAAVAGAGVSFGGDDYVAETGGPLEVAEFERTALEGDAPPDNPERKVVGTDDDYEAISGRQHGFLGDDYLARLGQMYGFGGDDYEALMGLAGRPLSHEDFGIDAEAEGADSELEKALEQVAAAQEEVLGHSKVAAARGVREEEGGTAGPVDEEGEA